MPKSTTPQPATTYAEAFPASRKVYDEQTLASAHGDIRLRVPMREVALTGGEPPVRLYDTSGPQGHDPRAGLPRLRRDAALRLREVVRLGRRLSATELRLATGGEGLAFELARKGDLLVTGAIGREVTLGGV